MNEVDQVDLGGALFASFLVVILNRGKFPSQKQDLLDTDFSERARVVPYGLIPVSFIN